MSRVIYTHFKGELAQARKARAKSKLHQEIERLNAAARLARGTAPPSYAPQLRKKGTTIAAS